jgi:hypothetical protein
MLLLLLLCGLNDVGGGELLRLAVLACAALELSPEPELDAAAFPLLLLLLEGE